MSAELMQALAGLILIVLSLLSLRVVPEKERLGILRRGRFIGIRGPGLVWIVPFVDRATRVRFDRDIPNWRSLTQEQLAEEIARRVTITRFGA